MAERVYALTKREHQTQQPRKHPRPRGWHEWLREARRKAEGGKLPHGRAVVRAKKLAARQTYTIRQWARMSTEKKLRIVAERLGIVRE